MKFFYLFAFFISVAGVCGAQNNPSLSAAYDQQEHAVKLRWQHTDAAITTYTLQRSSDNTVFTDIFTQKTGNLAAGAIVNFTDRDIREGRNYYRIKIFRKGFSYEATLPVIIETGTNVNSWVIYPVPVQSVLNLQYTGSGKIDGVLTVIVQSVSSGTIFVRDRLASTTRNIQIPVNNLGNGTYDIRIYIGTEAVWNQRFVK